METTRKKKKKKTKKNKKSPSRSELRDGVREKGQPRLVDFPTGSLSDNDDDDSPGMSLELFFSFFFCLEIISQKKRKGEKNEKVVGGRQ